MVDITLLELHLDDSNLTANAPFSSGRKQVEAGEGPPEQPESSGSKGPLVATLVGLVFLVVVGYLVRSKVLGGDETEEEEELEVSNVTA